MHRRIHPSESGGPARSTRPRRWAGVLVGLAAIVGTSLVAAPVQAAGTPETIRGIGGKCLDNYGGNLTDGNPVDLWTCNGSVAQQWVFAADGTIRNQDHCLAVPGTGAGVQTLVHIWTCDAKPGQLWRAGSGGTYVNPNSGLCLADANSNTGDGNPIWLYTCDGKPAQVWQRSGSGTPSGQAMPVGDLPADAQSSRGWRQVFTDDFLVAGRADADGRLPNGKWWGYGAGTPITNSEGHGVYDSSKVVSVAGGALTFNLHSEQGTAYAAVESPNLTGSQTYGRYDVRYRYRPGTNVAGFKSVWMTWPDDDHWGEGEIDFNEYANAANRNSVEGFVHHACGDDVNGCPQDYGSVVHDPTQWHTATAIWSPGKVTTYVDGRLLATSTTQVPKTPMHLLLQTEGATYGPVPTAGAVVLIDVDWVSVYARK